MPFFQWEDEYSIGIRIIDEQHKELVAMLNELYEAMHAGKGREALGRVLAGLIRYTRLHFAAEEQLMRAHEYPDYERHREKHEKMAAKVMELKTAYETEAHLQPDSDQQFSEKLAGQTHLGDGQGVWGVPGGERREIGF